MLDLLEIALTENRLESRLIEWAWWRRMGDGTPRCVSPGFELMRTTDIYCAPNLPNMSDEEGGLIDQAIGELRRTDADMCEAVWSYYISGGGGKNLRWLGRTMDVSKDTASLFLKQGMAWLHAYLHQAIKFHKKSVALSRQKH